MGFKFGFSTHINLELRKIIVSSSNCDDSSIFLGNLKLSKLSETLCECMCVCIPKAYVWIPQHGIAEKTKHLGTNALI